MSSSSIFISPRANNTLYIHYNEIARPTCITNEEDAGVEIGD